MINVCAHCIIIHTECVFATHSTYVFVYVKDDDKQIGAMFLIL